MCGAAIEACTGSADLAEELVEKAGWGVHLAHPGYVGRMRHNPDKTDFSDAHLLADLERVGYLPRVWLASPYIRQLRVLIRYRQDLVDQRKAVKLQIRALLRNERVRSEHRAWTAALVRPGWSRSRWASRRGGSCSGTASGWSNWPRRSPQVEQRLEQVTADDAVVARLQSLPQIGPVTAWWLRAQIGSFERFRRGKQLARFCGLSPRNASSGERQADSGSGGGRLAGSAAVPDGVGPSADAAGGSLAGTGQPVAGAGQADVRGGRGGGQPVRAVAVA